MKLKKFEAFVAVFAITVVFAGLWQFWGDLNKGPKQEQFAAAEPRPTPEDIQSLRRDRKRVAKQQQAPVKRALKGPGMGQFIVSTASSGTWTVPTGITSIDLLLIGGGGGGASAGDGGAGGGGGSISRTSYAVTPGAGISYSVGAGGAANSNGSDSTFGALTAGGGQGCVSGQTGAAGGTGDFAGGDGGDGSAGIAGGGGGGSGGRSAAGNDGDDFGAGGAGGTAVTDGGAGGDGDDGSGNPQAGAAPGGGGGGSGSMVAGGAGAVGYLQIDWSSAPPDAFRPIIEARARQQRDSMWTFRQSTAGQEVPLGKFVDETDGVTALTALTIANTDIKLQKTGGTTLVSKNSGGATHISGGRYYAVLDATDTDTIGPMKITVDVSGALPVEVWCEVLDEALYDWKYGTTAPGTGTALDAAGVRSAVGLASANLDTQLSTIDTVVDSILVDTAEIGAAGAGLTAVPWNASWDAEVQSEVQDAIEVNNLDHLVKSAVDTNWSTTVHLDSVIGHMADNGTSATFDRTTDSLEAARDNIGTAGASLSITASVIPNGSGTATAGAATTITLQTALGADDRVIGCEIDLTGGTGSGQTRTATDYVNSTQVLTVDRPWTTNPDNTTTYKIRHANSAVETVCKIGAAFTSTAGTEVRCSAWLERNGQIVTTYAASASCTVTFREHGSGTDLFSVTDSAVNAQGIFEVTQASPAFTSDRLYIASAAITEGGNVFTSRQPVPVR